MTIELIIFDCDGVLVDSEEIYNRVFHQMLAENGIAIQYKDSFAMFTGLSLQSCINFVKKEFGKSLPADFVIRYESTIMDLFMTELKPQKGILTVLEKIQQPVCVASGSSHQCIKLSLRVTDLLPRFGDNIFSASDVAHGKPAFDLFLYAAKQMGYSPEHCAVIEDSIPGVQAGIAAGMTVVAYTGSFTKDALTEAGAHFILDDMNLLLDLLGMQSKIV